MYSARQGRLARGQASHPSFPLRSVGGGSILTTGSTGNLNETESKLSLKSCAKGSKGGAFGNEDSRYFPQTLLIQPQTNGGSFQVMTDNGPVFMHPPSLNSEVANDLRLYFSGIIERVRSTSISAGPSFLGMAHSGKVFRGSPASMLCTPALKAKSFRRFAARVPRRLWTPRPTLSPSR